MKTVTKCLFGGALIGAGVCSSATAGELLPGFNWDAGSFSSAQAFLGTPDFGHSTGNFSRSSISPFGSASVSADQSGITLFADSTAFDDFARSGGDVSEAHVDAYFFVSESMWITIDWDFRGEISSYGPMPDTFLQIDGISIGVEGAYGSTQMFLEVDEEYRLIANMRDAAGFNTLSGSASTFTIGTSVASVPLPPAAFAGLGLLAGMGAYRRIRR